MEDSIKGSYFLKILVAGEFYAIDIFNVEEIINRVEITPVPRSPGYIVGVIKLRSEIIPIISMRERLGQPDGAGAEMKIIIFRLLVVGEHEETEITKVGIGVDETLDIIESSGMIEPPELARGDDNPFFAGFIRFRLGRNESDSIMVIDFEKLLDEAEKDQLATHHRTEEGNGQGS